MVRTFMHWRLRMQLTHIVINNNILILQPAGRMDIERSNEFEVALAELRKDKKFHVILDLTDVEYISSSYICSIISLKKSTYNAGEEFRLCNPNTFCRKIIDIVQLDKLVEVHATTQGAIDSIP